MEPQIKYVRTSDEVNVAYFMMGQGALPLVMMDAVYSNLQAEWADPRLRRQYEGIASVATFVRYDHRMFGLSDRDPADISLDGFVLDVEAVVERTLPERRFALFALRGVTTPIAVAYAARHPDRISHLVLATPMPRAPTVLVERMEAIVEAPGADERTVSESIARVAQGWDDHEASLAVAAMMRESVSVEGFKRWLAESKRWDVRGLLALVKMPTLVTSHKDYPIFGGDEIREMVALLPDARLVIIDGATSDARDAQTTAAIAAFLGAVVPPELRPMAVPSSGTAIILFTDIASSTELTERLGDARFRDASRALDASLRAAVRNAGGAAIDGKLLGDGVLATFPSAAQAIDGARRCLALSVASELGLHIGLHAGDVIREDNNVYGGAVNIASRICGLSAPGEILVSDVVRGMARSSAGVEFEDRGEQQMKGVGEPVRVYAVRGPD